MTLRPTAQGFGSPLLALTFVAQTAIALLLAGRTPPVEPVRPAVPLSLSAAAVVEPRLGGQPGALTGASLESGSRLQLSLETSQEAWTAVLWFEGDDRVVPLYPDPARDEAGWTAAATTYAVPSPGAWLRLTPTGERDDFVVVVSSLRPDPEILAVLSDPQADRVAALRQRLEARANARQPQVGAVERFLPTADGRAVAVPWRRITGDGALVIGWRIAVDSPAWDAPSMSSSSGPESPARSSPNAS